MLEHAGLASFVAAGTDPIAVVGILPFFGSVILIRKACEHEHDEHHRHEQYKAGDAEQEGRLDQIRRRVGDDLLNCLRETGQVHSPE
ncbi:MAG: hypothetical protein Q7W30_01465 [Coriobacteriia bacterium]|nr:hypothetical protein [Coriobacteriia bacterium]